MSMMSPLSPAGAVCPSHPSVLLHISLTGLHFVFHSIVMLASALFRLSCSTFVKSVAMLERCSQKVSVHMEKRKRLITMSYITVEHLSSCPVVHM